MLVLDREACVTIVHGSKSRTQLNDWLTEDSGSYLYFPQKQKLNMCGDGNDTYKKGKLISNKCTNGGGQDDGAVVGSRIQLSPPMHQECLKMQQF